jgi:hypothetical protein
MAFQGGSVARTSADARKRAQSGTLHEPGVTVSPN